MTTLRDTSVVIGGHAPAEAFVDETPALEIAATAAAARVPLLTANPRDFTGLEPLVEVIATG